MLPTKTPYEAFGSWLYVRGIMYLFGSLGTVNAQALTNYSHLLSLQSFSLTEL